MNVVDWVLVVSCLGVALAGFWKGAVRIVFGVGGVGAGAWLAVVAGSDVAVALSGTLRPDWLAAVVAVLLLVVACVGLGAVAGWGLERTLEALRLGWLNRTSGALLAGSVSLVAVSLLFGVAARSSPAMAALCERSLLVSQLLRVFDWLL